jgi:hypothetical protein
MHLVDTFPVIIVATLFVAMFGYLVLDSFWGRRHASDDSL